MNFFYRSLETVQEQAKLAAAQASALAQQASQQTAVLATSASGQAQQSFKSLSVPTSLQKRFEGLQLPNSRQPQAPSAEELQAYAITPEFDATVRGLTYSTFRDHRLPDGSSLPSEGSAQQSRYLTPWQERHALLICRQVKEIDELRFVLCPKRLTDQQFWTIYFQLVKASLPAEAFSASAPLPEATASRAQSSPETPLDLRAQLRQLTSSAQQWLPSASHVEAAQPAQSAVGEAVRRPDVPPSAAERPVSHAQASSAAPPGNAEVRVLALGMQD